MRHLTNLRVILTLSVAKGKDLKTEILRPFGPQNDRLNYHWNLSNRILVLILILSFFSLATVFKKKDAIQLTQTDPIRQEDKAKEEAEGKKGPPAPTIQLYPRERFLVEAPINPEEEEEIPEETEEWEEFEAGEFKLDSETDDTWEDFEEKVKGKR